MRDVLTRSHLRGSSVRLHKVIRGVGVELALSANMSNSTSIVTTSSLQTQLMQLAFFRQQIVIQETTALSRLRL